MREQQYFVQLPFLTLIFEKHILDKLSSTDTYEHFPVWPSGLPQLHYELQTHYRRIPIIIRQDKKGLHVLLCTATFYLKAVSTTKNDALRIIGMYPIKFREHRDLSSATVHIFVQQWHIGINSAAINTYNPHGINNGFHEMCNQWRLALAARSQQQGTQTSLPNLAKTLTPDDEAYLSQLEKVIQATYETDISKEKAKNSILFGEPMPVGKAHYNRHDIYKFTRVSQKNTIEKGIFVCLEEKPDFRGHIIDVTDETFTVRFERAVDLKIVRKATAFTRFTNHAAFRVQKDAIESLRTMQAENSNLLPILVHNRYQPYALRSDIFVPDNVSGAQRDAFVRAMSIKDMLLVLGPPGTGKTHTITEIARAYGKQHLRVLITSHTNKAVDNVLQSLPADLQVLRVGQEQNVTYANKHLLIEEQAKALQSKILTSTEPYHQALQDIQAHLAEHDRHIQAIPDAIRMLRYHQQEAQHAIRNKEQEQAAIHKKFDDALQYWQGQAVQAHQNIKNALKDIGKLEKQLVGAESRQHWFLIGFIEQIRAEWLSTSLDVRCQQFYEHELQQRKAEQEYEQIPGQKEQALRSPMYQNLIQIAKQKSDQLRTFVEGTYKKAQMLKSAIDKHMPPQQIPPLLFDSDSLLQYLQWHYNTWTSHLRDMLYQRYIILSEWRQELQQRNNDLYPVLLRMADVIGATCIGSATTKLLADVNFDVVIVDEAGQISLPNLIVPLVRGKRTILIGDHQQLPPLLDQDVVAHLQSQQANEYADGTNFNNENETQEITELLSKSVFEILVHNVPSANFVQFTQQRRMAASIAHFASQQFYEGKLQTAHQRKGYIDPLFKQPFVFVDTASSEPRLRRESKRSNPIIQELESDGTKSYINEGEAQLIVELAHAYTQENIPWVIIVPYKAQAHYIQEALTKRLGTNHDLNLNDLIATVDAFQGGERTVVIYGFTRSNKYYKIGFLSELRRLNVAITRARDQLILIGDSETLTKTSDKTFSSVAKDMIEHAKQQGEYISSKECDIRLLRRGRHEPK